MDGLVAAEGALQYPAWDNVPISKVSVRARARLVVVLGR